MRSAVAAFACCLTALAVSAPAAEAAGPPTVVGTWTSQVSDGSARMRAEIDPEGLPTSFRFQYASEAAYLAEGFAGAGETPKSGGNVGSGEDPTVVEALASDLTPATAYRYRVVAINSAATSVGPVRSLLTTATREALTLPDDRAWEMVSPVDKNGGEIQGFGGSIGGGVLQAAPAGEEVTYTSLASFGEAAGAAGPSQYLSTRGAAGWSTENISLPAESGTYRDDQEGSPFQLFSPELGLGLVATPHRCDLEPCTRSFSLWSAATRSADPLPYEAADLWLAGETPDLEQLVFSTCAALTPDSTEVPDGSSGCDPGKPNLYRVGNGTIQLINLLPGDTVGTPGAELGAQGRAISDDGARVYWTDGEALFLRAGGETVEIEGSAGGPAAFQTAAPDGSVAFFTEGGHLYRYLAAGETATDLTPSGGVVGVFGASDDGAYVYFEDGTGVVLWHAGETETIAPEADPASFPPTTGTARVSADGLHLAFVTSAGMPGYDNRNATSKVPEPEVYLYSAATGTGPATLLCASCRPSGMRPEAAASLPGAGANGVGGTATHVYKPRVLTASGDRLFFETSDAVSRFDTNKDRDVYLWQAQGSGGCGRILGCVDLISSGHGPDGASFIDASADGDDAFFLTSESLDGGDLGETDVYDARANGGFPEIKPEDCFGDDCQSLPPAPEDPTPGTLRSSGTGNPPTAHPRKRCPRGKVRKKGRCVKKKHHRGKRASR